MAFSSQHLNPARAQPDHGELSGGEEGQQGDQRGEKREQTHQKLRGQGEDGHSTVTLLARLRG